jgi:outer membrane immunogenic protein
MRKYCTCLLVTVISVSFCFAQEKKRGTRPSFGIMGGVTGSTITHSAGDYNNNLLIGWQAGALMLLDCGSPDHFVFGAEANISSEGSKYAHVAYSGKVILTYLNIPIVAQFRDEFGFYAEAGLQPGILLGAKDKYNGTTDDIKDDFNSFDFSIPFGIGYIYRKKLGINARYTLGVSDIDKAEHSHGHNHVWALRLFYVFP